MTNFNKIAGVRTGSDADNRMEILDGFPKRLRLLLKNAPYDYVVQNIPQQFKGVPLGQICDRLEATMAAHVLKAYKYRGFEQ